MRLGWRQLWQAAQPDLVIDRPAVGFVLTRLVLPVAAVLAIHFALRMAYAGSVEPDDADLILYTQHLAWGYSDQGPLYSWLCELAFAAFGVGEVALTAVRTAVLFAGCVLLYHNARLLCRDKHLALLAGYSVLLIPNLSWHALVYLTHTNLLLVVCLATLFTFLRLARDGRTLDYLLFGAACGAGVLSKYNYVWFAAALIAAGLTVGPIRRRLLDARMLLAGAVCGLIVLPHALWVAENREAIRQVLQTKTHRTGAQYASYLARVGRGTWDAVSAGVIMAVPVAGLVALFFPRGRSDPDPDRAVARTMLGRFFVLVVVVVFAQIYLLGVSRFHERWLQPFLVVFPLWLFAGIDPASVRPSRARAFAVLLALFAVAYTAARAVQVTVYADQPRGLYPLRLSFDELARRIKAEVGDRPVILTPEREVGGNLLLKLPSATVCCTAEPLYPVELGSGPVVVAWNLGLTRGRPVLPWCAMAEFRDRYEQPVPMEAVRTVEVAPAANGKPPTVIAYVVLPGSEP
ncbi:MAG TPA: glycosyltransferase family 39 protein [Fimbriiglobus sp.]|nr:glycosyltransferase family 39 protein [Fimbriiglobus sp.]